MAAKRKPRRIDSHMGKFSRALAVVQELESRDPARDASLQDVQRHYKRKEAAYRAMWAHRKALDDGVARDAGLKEKPPSVTRLLCQWMWAEPRCRKLIEPWLAGQRTLAGAEIEHMASFVANLNQWGGSKLPDPNTIRRQLARQFQKRVKSSDVDALPT